MTVFDAYDRIRIVSLASRKDRRAAILEELRPFDLAHKLEFFDALTVPEPGPFRSRGSHGCFLSHLQILSDAARSNESVLILQDDCAFLPEIRAYAMPECDVFYGSHAEDADEIIGAHFMGFSAPAAAKASHYLENLLDTSFPPDPKAATEPTFKPGMRPPIDGSLVWFRRAHPELKSAFALLSYQRSSRSDITPRLLDRIPLVRGVLQILRKFAFGRKYGGEALETRSAAEQGS